MLKRKLIANSMIIAILMVFALQIGMFGFTVASKKNVTGVVYGSSGVPLSSASVFVSGSEGSGYTTTDGVGHYLISDGLPAGNYTVGAFKIGYVDTETQDVIITAGHETTLDLYMNRSGGISGKVTDSATDIAIPNIGVFASLSSGGGTYFGSGMTDTVGNYEINMNLGTGTYNVSVLFPKGYVSKTVSPVDVVAGSRTTGIDLALDRSGIISGSITAIPGGQPIANASVTAISDGEGMAYFGTDETDATGHYSISTGLGTANYTVMASYASSFNMANDVSVTAGQETSNVDIQLTLISPPPPTFSGTITGTVTNASNSQPIEDAHVVANADTTSGYGDNYTDSNGYYIISEGLTEDDTYTVTASAFGYQDATLTDVNVQVNQTTSNVNLQLTKIPTAQSGRISGTVSGDANPIPEFEYPIAIMMIITLIAVALAKTSTRKLKPY